MFTSTTHAQLTRAVAVWVLGCGVALFPFVAAQLWVWDDPGGLLLSLALMTTGAGAWWWATVRLRQLDVRNRDFLLSPHGVSIMAGRHAFARRVVAWKRVLLGVFLGLGVVMMYVVSALACGDSTQGFCASAAQISESSAAWLRWITIGVGAAYIGAVALGAAHRRETDRMDVVIAAGQRQRDDGPTPGLSRSRWD